MCNLPENSVQQCLQFSRCCILNVIYCSILYFKENIVHNSKFQVAIHVPKLCGIHICLYKSSGFIAVSISFVLYLPAWLMAQPRGSYRVDEILMLVFSFEAPKKSMMSESQSVIHCSGGDIIQKMRPTCPDPNAQGPAQ